MRASRMTNEQLAASAASHRREAEMGSGVMSEGYCRSQIEFAEVFEELLDHRLRLGHAEN